MIVTGANFVGNSLSPGKALRVEVVDLATRTARVTVPDFQLSLAIGREGQNARLAARLTGWRIDIRPDNEVVPEEPAAPAQVVAGPQDPPTRDETPSRDGTPARDGAPTG